jgi:hypothetical protein
MQGTEKDAEKLKFADARDLTFSEARKLIWRDTKLWKVPDAEDLKW